MIEDLNARHIHRRLRARVDPLPPPPPPPPGAPAAPTDSTVQNPPLPSNQPPPPPPPPNSAPPTSAATTATSATSASSPATSLASTTSVTSSSAPTSSASPTPSTPPPTSSPTPNKPPVQSTPPASHTSSFTSAHASVSPSLPHHSSSISASPTAATDTSGTLHAPVVVGIVVAVLAGVIGIVFAATYFMRRSRREDDFGADALRRQSMILPDEATMRGRGTTPRPPSIIEQHLSQGPASLPQFGDRSFYGGSSTNSYYGQSSFTPGEIVSMPPQAWSPVTHESARPFYNPMGDSPMGSPISPAPYDSYYNAQGQIVRQPSPGPGAMLNRQPSSGAHVMLNRQPSAGAQAMLGRHPSNGAVVMLNRQPSNGAQVMLNRQPSSGAQVMLQQHPSHGPGAALRVQPNLAAPFILDQPPSAKDLRSPISPVPVAYAPRQPQVPAQDMHLNPAMFHDAHYVDLSRSSVSPFQAAQYAEISSKLHALPPKPLPSPEVAAVAHEILMKPGPVIANVAEPRPLNVATNKTPSLTDSPRESYAVTVEDEDDLVMPAPSFSGKARIDSTPPTLPEMDLPRRSFSPVSLDFNPPSGHASPSPLTTSFTVPSPPPEAHLAGSTAPANLLAPETAASAIARRAKEEAAGKRPDTVYTLYDDEDAYAGI